MAKYKVKIEPIAGQPHTEFIQADSYEAAIEVVMSRGVHRSAIEIIEPRFEPLPSLPPPPPRVVEADLTSGSGLIMRWAVSMAVASAVLTGVAIADPGGSGAARVVLFFVPFFFLGAVGAIVHGRRTRAMRKRLYAEGVSTTATVTGVSKGTFHFGNKYINTMRWTFTIDGDTYVGACKPVDVAPPPFSAGDPIWVLYDPADPSTSVEWPPI